MVAKILKGDEFPCAFCKGTGVLRKTNSQCPVCRGQGVVKVTPPAAICAYCRGRGDVPARSYITCPVCGGRGVVPIRQPIEACPHCRGRGTAPTSQLPCLVCNGKGVLTARSSHGMPEENEATSGRAEVPQTRYSGEAYPISLRPVPLPTRACEEAPGLGYLWQPQRRREKRRVTASPVSGLVRRLMATERARILGRKARRWREERRRPQ